MGRCGLHLGARAPRHRDAAAPIGAGDRGKARNRQRALEARRIIVKFLRTVRLDRERTVRRVEPEADLDAVLADLARRKAIAVSFARRREPALAFRRAEQRAQFAAKPETLERKTCAAHAVVQRDTRILDRD